MNPNQQQNPNNNHQPTNIFNRNLHYRLLNANNRMRVRGNNRRNRANAMAQRIPGYNNLNPGDLICYLDEGPFTGVTVKIVFSTNIGVDYAINDVIWVNSRVSFGGNNSPDKDECILFNVMVNQITNVNEFHYLFDVSVPSRTMPQNGQTYERVNVLLYGFDVRNNTLYNQPIARGVYTYRHNEKINESKKISMYDKCQKIEPRLNLKHTPYTDKRLDFNFNIGPGSDDECENMQEKILELIKVMANELKGKKDEFNRTVVFYFCHEGILEGVKLCMELGYDFFHKDIFGKTPLHYVRTDIIRDLFTEKSEYKKIISSKDLEINRNTVINHVEEQILIAKKLKEKEYKYDKAINVLQLTLKFMKEKGIYDSDLNLSIMNEIGLNYYEKSDYNNAILFFKLLLKESEKRKCDMNVVFHNLGEIYFNKAEYDKSIEYLLRSLEINKRVGNDYGIATTLHVIGNVYLEKSEYAKALEYYEKSLDIQKKTGNISGISSTLHAIGNIYSLKSEYDKAFECYNKSLEIKEKVGNLSGIASIFHAFGNIYSLKSEFDKAIEYFNKSLEIDDKIGNVSGKASTLHAIGNIYSEKYEYDNAIEYFNKSLEINEKIGNISGIASTLHAIGNICSKKSEYDKAIEYFNKSLEINEKIGNVSGIASTLHAIGNTAIYSEKSEYDKAIEYFNKSLEINEKIGNISGMASSLRYLGWIYYSKKDFTKSRNYLQKSIKIWENIKVEYISLQKNKQLLHLVESEIEKMDCVKIQNIMKDNCSSLKNFVIIERVGQKIEKYVYFDKLLSKYAKSKLLGDQFFGTGNKFFGSGAAVFKCYLKGYEKELLLAMKICYNYGYNDYSNIYNEFIEKHIIKRNMDGYSYNFMEVLHHFVDEVDFKKFPSCGEINTGFVQSRSAILLFPYCEFNLKQIIIKKRKFDSIRVLKYMKDLLVAICELYRNGIVHRDLKPDNVLVSSRDNLIITDFELQIKCLTEKEDVVDDFQLKYTDGLLLGGATRYLPPEIMTARIGDDLDYSKCDIFSVGVICYELVATSIKIKKGNKMVYAKLDPFGDVSTKERSEDNYVELDDTSHSLEIRNLVKEMIHPVFSKRIDCFTALKRVSKMFDKEMKIKYAIERKEFQKI